MGLTLNIPKNNTGPKTVDLTPAVSDFIQAVKEWPPRTPSMDIRVRYVRRVDLPDYVFEGGQRPSLRRKASTGKRKEPEPPADSPDPKKPKSNDGQGQTEKAPLSPIAQDGAESKKNAVPPQELDSPELFGITNDQPLNTRPTLKKPVINLL